ncbi:MAG TPA: hypothetical protein VKG24_05165 [Pseudolabrys sp.]|nr:hypothetical protein [Pseudolabrys sp.]
MGSNTMPPLDPNDDDDDDDDEEEDEEEEDEEDEDPDEEPAVKNLIILARAWRHAATASQGTNWAHHCRISKNRRAGSASVSPKKN